MSPGNPLERPELAELPELDAKVAELKQKLDSVPASSELGPLYSRGVDVVTQQIGQIVSPEFQTELVTYGQEAATNLEGLEPLQGVLPDEEIVPLRDDYTQRLEQVRSFRESYGTYLDPEVATELEQSLGEVATVAQVEPIPATDPEGAEGEGAAPTPETEPTELTLTVRGSVLKIGKDGRVVPFSRKTNESHRDYSLERRDALQRLVEESQIEDSDGWLRPKEMKADNDISSSHFLQVTNWLLGLTFRNKKLIEKEGTRGGSVYRFCPDFNVSLIFAKAPTKRATKEQAKKGLLDKGDVYIALNQLENYRPILQNLEIPVWDEDLVDAIKPYAPDYSHIRNDTKAIRDVRAKSLGRIYDFMDDEERFLAYIDNSNAGDPDHKFVEYLLDLEAEQRDVLKSIMSAVEVYREDRPDGYVMIALDANDNPVAKTRLITDRPATQFEELIQPEDDSTELVDAAAEALLLERNAVPATEEPETPKRSKLSTAQRQKLDSLRVAARDAAKQFVAHYDPTKTYTAPQLRSNITKLTRAAIAAAGENNILPERRVHRNLGIRDVVAVVISTDPKLREVLHNPRTRRQAKFVIEETIRNQVEADHQTRSKS